MSANTALLEVKHLSTWLESGDAVVRAVDGLSFTIRQGETFALLGESGSGKSMTALSIMRLLPDAGRIVGGEVRLNGTRPAGSARDRDAQRARAAASR